MRRIAVDIGGTFTDLVAFENSSFHVVKIPTTSKEPEAGVIESIKRADMAYDFLIHATTVATNSLLTGKYGKIALITTYGFRDVIEIGRQNRAEMYNLYFTRPRPLIPRQDRYEVKERIDPNGNVEIPLDNEEVMQLAESICGKYDGVLIAFINSYSNPEHERLARDIILNICKGAVITLSTDVDMEMKEYERASTAAVNAVLKPVMSNYVNRLTKEIKNILIMQSSGGFAGPEVAIDLPAVFVESGPTAGAVGVHYLANLMGIEKALGFDMGGTTAKASTVIDGKLTVTNEYEVAGKAQMGRMIRGSGYPVRFPFIDLSEVSGGGGTIAWRDRGGALRVGPQSAESDPGPACYGKGGKEPTITDANLVLGRIGNLLSGGELTLNPELSREAISTLGIDVEETALQIISLVNDQMAKAIRIVTVERGLDPSEFTAIGFGGAGPLHIGEIMEDLGIKRAIIPPFPGVFSAFGLIVSDYKHDFVKPYVSEQEESLFNEMVIEAHEMLEKEGYSGEIFESRFADMRYMGQSFELTIPYSDHLKEDFHDAFEKKYSYAMPDRSVEIVNLRLSVVGSTDKPQLAATKKTDRDLEPIGQRNVVFKSGALTANIYRRDDLLTGQNLSGPAIIESYDSTILVPQGFKVSIDKYQNVVMER